ncbi:MAG TPA: electron transfer flavoprotein subunit alpha/FixB family protein [Anaerolineales bacterium]
MADTVWVYIDHFKGDAHAGSWEAVGAARSLGEQMGSGVTAVVLGSQVQDLAQQAFHHGANDVLLVDEAALEDYRAEPYASALSQLAQARDPAVILFPTTTRGRELAAVAAVDLDTGVMPDVTELELDNGTVVVTRPVYAGKLLSKARCNTRPQMITLRLRAFSKPEADESKSGTVTSVDVELPEEAMLTQVVEYSQAEQGVSLSDAAVIVSGGRGVAVNPTLEPPSDLDDKQAEIWKAQQGFKLVEELAEVLGAAVGASRAAVDAGYIPYEHQVGQTGKVVSPDLYIACGISGAIQHLAGMRTSKVIVAINKDPEAPIFKLARFGVVGDLYDVLPQLIEAFREKLEK